MKLQLLHGPAINSSRSKLLSFKKGFKAEDVIVFEKGLLLKDIQGSLTTASLLSDERLVIWENPPEDIKELTLDENTTLVFWFDHQVDEKKPLLDFVKSKKGQILNFPESREVSIFPFLDLLADKDKKAYLELEKLKRAGFDVQYFISMVFYLLRSLVNPPNSPTFIKMKIERQRKNFSQDKLVSLYKFLLELDFKIKSGLLEPTQAEFLMVNRFISSALL